MKTIYDEDELNLNTRQTTKTTIFYFTGTGNSLWAARVLARELGNTELISIVDWNVKKHKIHSPVIGLVFPVHIWGVPSRVLEFLDDLKEMSADYVFAIANNAGQISNTLIQLNKAMKAKDFALASGWSIVMPSNYIPGEVPVPCMNRISAFRKLR